MAIEIGIEGIHKTIGTTKIVQDVSLRVPAGAMTFVLGPSGCGKTTLLRMVAGLTDPTAGRIRFGDRDVTDVPTRQRNLGMVFQSYALWPHMSVLDNVAFGLRMRKVSKPDRTRRAEAMLDSVGLTGLAARKPAQLSGGQQQRVALARALVVEPEVLLLDEPLSNLDANLRVQLRELIRRLCAETGVTAIYVTHDQEEAMALADEIVVMRQGRIQQAGSPTEIYSRPTSAGVAQFLGETNLIEAKVASVTTDEAVLEAASGAIRAHLEGFQPVENDRVLVSIRPESIQFAEGTGAAGNTFEGKIATSTRRGLWSRLSVEVKGGARLIVHEPGAKVHEPGAPCTLTVDPAEVVVLPHAKVEADVVAHASDGRNGHAPDPA